MNLHRRATVKIRILLPLGALTLLAFTSPPAALAEEGSIVGTVHYEGPGFRIPTLRMQADPKCEELHESGGVRSQERLVSKEGGVANVFVYLAEAPEGTGPFEAPEEPKRLNQEGCLYQPRVQGILVQQKLEVANDDPTLHNVRFLASENRPFNIGQPPDTAPRVKFFTEPEEAVKFKCDVHPWMSAYLFIMDHPYFAVTDESGAFAIPGLPPGTYELKAWHESFGELAHTVHLTSGETEVAFTYVENESE